MDIGKKSGSQVIKIQLPSVVVHAPDIECVKEVQLYEPNIQTLGFKQKFRKEKAHSPSRRNEVSQISTQISNFMVANKDIRQIASSSLISARSVIISVNSEDERSERKRKVGKRKPIRLACSTICNVF